MAFRASDAAGPLRGTWTEVVPYSLPQDRSPSIPIRQPRVVALTVAPPFLRRPGRPPLPYLPYGDEKKVAGGGRRQKKGTEARGKGGAVEKRGRKRGREGGRRKQQSALSLPPTSLFILGRVLRDGKLRGERERKKMDLEGEETGRKREKKKCRRKGVGPPVFSLRSALSLL